MRCLALAQAWREVGGEVTVRTACRVPALIGRFAEPGVRVESVEGTSGDAEDAVQTAEAAVRYGASWVVVDGYHFSGEFQRQLRAGGAKVLAIDDYGHAEHYWADLVLNQNLHATDDLYLHREKHTHLLLGPRYALLRREFWGAGRLPKTIPATARNLLVTLGGADPDNATMKVIQVLALLPEDDLQIAIVVGSANRHRALIESAVRSTGIRMEVKVNVVNMAELIAWADIALTAGGSTCWEMAAMGLPSVVIAMAANQLRSSELLGERRIVRYLGPYIALDWTELRNTITALLSDWESRSRMSQSGRLLVDGRGACRVARLLRGEGRREV